MKNVLALTLWTAALLSGFAVLTKYSLSEGRAPSRHSDWPAAVPRDSSAEFTLVMFLHPHCPCSRATVHEVDRIVARTHGRLRVLAYFVRPNHQTEAWVKSDIWEDAQRIPGLVSTIDEGGQMSIRFGAWTSGQTFLFDRHGNEIFQGGLTATRGHEGDSEGQRIVLTAINDHASISHARTQVFGCALTTSHHQGGHGE
ncbi:MAG: hypothetical protein JST16_03470 [Bdellovibrionales bacterium]|nr:hypothetical protein [Bdellovibrionales bacterium]